MKSSSKRFWSICVAFVLATALAAPAFATSNMAYGTYTLSPVVNPETDSRQYYLNVVGNSQVSQNRDVNIYTYTGDPDQIWAYELCYDGNARMKSTLSSKEYALNVYYPSTGATDLRCDIMMWSSNLKDSALIYRIESYRPGIIRLNNYWDYILAVNGVYNGSPAIWHRDGYGSGTYATCW